MTFAVAGQVSTRPIFSNGLPALNAWFLHTAGPGNVSVQLEFADANDPVPAGPDWRPLIAPYAIVPLIPSLTNRTLGARQYRATVSSDGGATVRFHITATIG